MTSLHSAIGGVNYGHYAGVESVEAAITFAVLYILLITLYVYLATKLPRYFIPILLLCFCTLRVASFIIRALLAGRESVGQNLHLAVSHVYLYDLGFLALLYNAYMVVRDRELPSNASLFQRAVGYIVRNRIIINPVFLAVYVLGVVGTPDVDDIELINHPNIYRTIIICLLFALTVLIAMRGLLFVRQELSSTSTDKETVTPLDPPYPMYAICLIVLLLLVRQTFFMATLVNQKIQNNEKLFYPLSALTEFVAACLFVPPWEELVTIRGSFTGSH